MMINKYREIENEYINIFSAHENCSGYERFYDDKLPGMYAFNCIFIKESTGEEICRLLADKLKEYKDRKQEFLKVLVHPEVIVMSTNPGITIWRHRHYHAEEHD